MPVNKDDLIAKMVQARQRLDAALEHLVPQAEVYPAWKLKQLLDHITGWDELVVEILKAHQHGASLPLTAKNINLYNDRSITSRTAIPLEQSRQDYETARLAVIGQLLSMPDELFAKKFTAPWGGESTVRRMLMLFIDHEQEHAKQVENIAANS